MIAHHSPRTKKEGAISNPINILSTTLRKDFNAANNEGNDAVTHHSPRRLKE